MQHQKILIHNIKKNTYTQHQTFFLIFCYQKPKSNKQKNHLRFI